LREAVQHAAVVFIGRPQLKLEGRRRIEELLDERERELLDAARGASGHRR
jgi:hypothetical protein